MNYCPICATKLILKPCADEGEVSYCETCQNFHFELFPTCVLVVLFSPDKKKICLLKQSYVHQDYLVLIAGFVKRGETLEQTVCREVKEETGIDVGTLFYISSFYHEKSGALMAGFSAVAQSDKLVVTSREVDSAKWVEIPDALSMMKPGSLGHKLLRKILKFDR